MTTPEDQKAASEREQELEDELTAANEYNDTDRPLSEVMAAISDAVMDFQPDVESASAGTLIERVETAAELARKAGERESELDRLVKGSMMFIRCAVDNDPAPRDGMCKCAGCAHARAILAAINAALEEKR